MGIATPLRNTINVVYVDDDNKSFKYHENKIKSDLLSRQIGVNFSYYSNFPEAFDGVVLGSKNGIHALVVDLILYEGDSNYKYMTPLLLCQAHKIEMNCKLFLISGQPMDREETLEQSEIIYKYWGNILPQNTQKLQKGSPFISKFVEIMSGPQMSTINWRR